MSDIMLTDLMNIGDPSQYKLHLGCRNPYGEHPLDLYIEDKSTWKDWNEWKNKNRNDWSRGYIFSLIEFYPRTNCWLFGGIFKVLDRKGDTYSIEEVEDFSKYTGRLILSFYRYQGMRGRAFYLESHIGNITVSQILEAEYTGEVFPGYDKINHDFSVLKNIVSTDKLDWKTALYNIKGVYLIVDKSNGKAYVGSAYGESGIWSRMACYMGTGHGWNDQLVALIKSKGKDYADNNFRFTLLEIHGMYSTDDFIIGRENYWKDKLGTREHGYNCN